MVVKKLYEETVETFRTSSEIELYIHKCIIEDNRVFLSQYFNLKRIKSYLNNLTLELHIELVRKMRSLSFQSFFSFEYLSTQRNTLLFYFPFWEGHLKMFLLFKLE